jgi:GNAT superfamily N-acetyltransferase
VPRILVRAATRRDAPGIAGVHVRGWNESYRGAIADALLDALDEEKIERRWSQIIGSGEQIVLVACLADGKVAGFASAGHPKETIDGFDCELHKLYVLRDLQGCGVGKALLQAIASRLCEAGCRAMISHVLANSPSRNFYERFGADLLQTVPVTIRGDSYMDALYGWRDIRVLTEAQTQSALLE